MTKEQELLQKREHLLRELNANTDGLRALKCPAFDASRSNVSAIVLRLVVRFTDGTINVTNWVSGEDRRAYEASVRKLYGIRVADIQREVAVKGEVKLSLADLLR